MFIANSLLSRQIGAACVKSAARFTMPKHMSVAQAKAFSTYYLQTHEYITVKDGIGSVGITDVAAKALGDVIFIELPRVGQKFKARFTIHFMQSQPFGSVESVKAASDLYCPLNGEVVEVNTALESTPTIVNQSPFEKGWFIKIKLEDKFEDEIKERQALEEGDSLLDQDLYDKHTAVPYYA